MMHWARKYICRQWSPDGEGPARFSCWGLVRTVLRDEFGVHVPALLTTNGGLDSVAMRHAAREKSFCPAAGRPVPGDIVVMSSVLGPHCGLVLWANNRLSVLHSWHETGVVCEPWRDAVNGMRAELWRQT